MLRRRFLFVLVPLTLLVIVHTVWKWNEFERYVPSFFGRTEILSGKKKMYQSIVAANTKTDSDGTNEPLYSDDARFLLKHTFRFPAPKYTKQDALQSSWVEDLKHFLKTLLATQVTIVTASEEHKSIVVNWLVSALIKIRPPLENVLVLAVSSSLYEYLKIRGIQVIYVDPASLISSHAVETFGSVFAQIHLVRLTFFRLINHWGYDVIMYDSDAILLKNPQSLFDKYPEADLVGSAGIGPERLSSQWGRTVCTGVLLLRATSKTEQFWTVMSTISSHLTDQGLVNEALFKMHIKWNITEARDSTLDMRGISPRHRLQSVILSEESICRYTCDVAKREQYFAWHKPAINKERTIKNKIERAQDGDVWYLIDGWNMKANVTGVRWLQSVTKRMMDRP